MGCQHVQSPLVTYPDATTNGTYSSGVGISPVRRSRASPAGSREISAEP
jgi:hypothetical protein